MSRHEGLVVITVQFPNKVWVALVSRIIEHMLTYGSNENEFDVSTIVRLWSTPEIPIFGLCLIIDRPTISFIEILNAKLKKLSATNYQLDSTNLERMKECHRQNIRKAHGREGHWNPSAQ